MDTAKIFSEVLSLKDEMVKVLSSLVSYPALAPQNGGEGELLKAEHLAWVLRKTGLSHITWYNSKDNRVSSGYRPSITVKIPGKTSRKMWIISHLDVVPEGDISLWDSNPFQAVVKEGNLYARGANDNGQELVASIFAVLALKNLGIIPQYEVHLCFAADEELGSEHGIQYLISKNLFSPDDLVLIPVGGNGRGDFVEVAEKGILWIEFNVTGKQCDGSMPHLGINACRVANILSVRLDEALHKAFPEKNELFNPPVSTIEPTRRSDNVGSVYIIPGKETFVYDCRILPSVKLDQVLDVVGYVCRRTGHEYSSEIGFKVLQRNDSSEPTSKESGIVIMLKNAISHFYGIEPCIGGTGGVTCAAFFRQAGIPAAVWAQKADVVHMPNEYAVIEHMVNEASVFALMMSGI